MWSNEGYRKFCQWNLLAALWLAASSSWADPITDHPNPQQPAASKSAETPATPPTSPLTSEVQKLATRIADLYLCVPSERDSSYSTASWYLMNTFRGWNNAVAQSSLNSETKFSDDLIKIFNQTAVEEIRKRSGKYADDETVKAFIAGASNTARITYNNAVSAHNVYKKTTDLGALMVKSHEPGEENIFKRLRTAHEKNLKELRADERSCADLGSRFWETPKFFASEEPVKKEETKIPTQRASQAKKQSHVKEPKIDHDVEEVTLPAAKPVQTKKSPPTAPTISSSSRSRKISAYLPTQTFGNRDSANYYTYRNSDYRWGRPQVVQAIKSAAQYLRGQGITMGVGDMNIRGDERKPTPNHGWTDDNGKYHNGHANGDSADFRLINHDGVAEQMDLRTKSGRAIFDRNKTFTMIKALIDADRGKVDVLFVNDDVLLGMIRRYMYQQGYTNVASRIKRWPGHDNHVHIRWKL